MLVPACFKCNSSFSSIQFSSVAQVCSTLCDPIDSKHTRPPCLRPTPRVYQNSYPLSPTKQALYLNSSFQFSHSVVSNSLRPHDCSTPGFPVYHQLTKLAQTQVHQVSDAIQPSHPLSSPLPPATFNLSLHQGLFKWVSSAHQMDKVLEFQLQHQFFQWIFRTDFP